MIVEKNEGGKKYEQEKSSSVFTGSNYGSRYAGRLWWKFRKQ